MRPVDNATERPLPSPLATHFRIPAADAWISRIPLLVATITAVTGLACILRGLGLDSHGKVWAETASPSVALPIASGLMIPAGVSLLILTPAVWGRRRRAWNTCMVLFALLGVLAVLVPPSRLTILATWGTLALLLVARDRFVVPGGVPTARTPRAAYVLLALAIASAFAAAWLTMGQAAEHWSWSTGSRQVVAMLVAATAPLDPSGIAAVLAAITGVLGLTSIGLVARAALAAPVPPPDATEEPGIDRALSVVRAHGDDSLSFFTLRPDVTHVWSPDGRAFAAVRCEAGVLIISGDPVGPDDAIPGLLRELSQRAAHDGVTLAALGADEAMCAIYRQMGMRRIYIGDEAVVDTRRFTLQGRPIRKVRQSVNRLERMGFSYAMTRLGDLDPATVEALRDISLRWRDGEAERGFTMALDDLGGRHQRDTWVAIARDANGVPRGFLQFVPAGSAGASLSFMRRDLDAPNGLSEFLVALSLESFREAGVTRVSLNFATFGKLLRAPTTRRGRLAKRLIRQADRFFQVDSLLSFNEKFFPDWSPRYLMYPHIARLPRVAVACLRAEGQMPRSFRDRIRRRKSSALRSA